MYPKLKLRKNLSRPVLLLVGSYLLEKLRLAKTFYKTSFGFTVFV